jgi:hypothetical protein
MTKTSKEQTQRILCKKKSNRAVIVKCEDIHNERERERERERRRCRRKTKQKLTGECHHWIEINRSEKIERINAKVQQRSSFFFTLWFIHRRINTEQSIKSNESHGRIVYTRSKISKSITRSNDSRGSMSRRQTLTSLLFWRIHAFHIIDNSLNESVRISCYRLT